MKTTTLRLIEAARWISRYENGEITAIQFEDGSGDKFNYQVNGGSWKFITWAELVDGLGFNPDNLCRTA